MAKYRKRFKRKRPFFYNAFKRKNFAKILFTFWIYNIPFLQKGICFWLVNTYSATILANVTKRLDNDQVIVVLLEDEPSPHYGVSSALYVSSASETQHPNYNLRIYELYKIL